jgi:hypothetical protein
MKPSRRLGWLGPAIVGLGVVVAALGIWFMVYARPVAGDVIDTFLLDASEPKATLVVRAEAGGDRSFVELRRGTEVVWQALIPTYGGRTGVPGLAWNDKVVSIRVVRDGHAELFGLAMHDASKLGGMRLAPEHGPIDRAAAGPVTLTDHIRSYEVVAGPDWHQLVAIDLASGKALWSRELGAAPVVDGGVLGGLVWVEQAPSSLGKPPPRKRRHFRVFNGAEDANADEPAL